MSIHVDGEYKDEDGNTAIQLVRGYSRDHRPELNQVILNLITENQAGIPVNMQASSGYINDNEGFKNIVKQHVKSFKAAHNNRYFIGDSALYTAETIQSLDEPNQLFISTAPQKLTLVKAAISAQDNYRFTPLENGYRASWIDSNYGDVKQRWLLVFSE